VPQRFHTQTGPASIDRAHPPCLPLFVHILQKEQVMADGLTARLRCFALVGVAASTVAYYVHQSIIEAVLIV
jgi:hypothetical protein